MICTVISLDPNVDPDIPALLSASAALSISGLPFEGPIREEWVTEMANIF